MIFHYLPKSLAGSISTQSENGVEEIRLRSGQPTELIYSDNRIVCLPEVSGNEIMETLNYLCGYSVYLLEKEIKHGFFTARGGHRVGICGRTTEHGIADISGLNIRVAHEKKDCAREILPYIRDGECIHNTLILAPPGVGKTTYLRDLIRLLSSGDDKHPGVKISVVDERSEIAACYRGVPQNDLGPRVDVLDECPKVKGMLMVLRSMSPQVIAVDELGMEEDFLAVLQILYSGSRILGTLHCRDIQELRQKPYLQEILQGKKVTRYVLLLRDEEGERHFQIYDEKLEPICAK